MALAALATEPEPIDQRISKIYPRVPDPQEGRWCKTCKTWVPVKSFPSGKRRYSCNLHRWAQTGKKSHQKRMATGQNKILNGIWIKAYSDSKLFAPVWKNTPTKTGSNNVKRVNITPVEIKGLLFHMVQTFNVPANTRVDLFKVSAIVPISPTSPVSIGNAALVPTDIKRLLLKAFRVGGITGYTHALNLAETQENIVFRPSNQQLDAMQETLRDLEI